jgi:hypothetical protein
MEETLFEIVKRDGRREGYARSKLARSLRQAGVPPYMLEGILDTVAPYPDQDTGSLRASIESELENWHPAAARRYAQTRRVPAFGSDAIARGRVDLHPETLAQFQVMPGNPLWLGENRARLPLIVETTKQIGLNQAWLNSADLADLDVNPGARILTSGVCPASADHGVFPLSRRQEVPLPVNPW